MEQKKKKLAVVASGWHFPYHFYKAMADQKVPEGWTIDLFCVSHRDPHYSFEEKKKIFENLSWSYPEVLDKVLYEKEATVEEIEKLGWNYKLYPNTIGDFGNTNQWLEDHDYKEYDILLMTHDDNLLLNDTLFTDLITNDADWMILSNSTGSAQDWREFIKVRILGRAMNVRGSFEFIRSEVFEMMGGKFDMTGVTLSREGQFNSPESFKSINNWNMAVLPFRKFLTESGVSRKIKALATTYRVSDYCIEGERGFVSSIQPADRSMVERGLARIARKYGPSW